MIGRLFVAALLWGCGPPVRLLDAKGGVLRECTSVDYATTPEARQLGLGKHAPLDQTQLLVLRYPVVDEACITNGPVSFPIVALFVDGAGGVLAVERFAAKESAPRCHRGVADVLELEASLPDGVVSVTGLAPR